MKKTSAFLCMVGAVALLSACESVRKTFSGEKSAPDEFAVYSRPPLSMPPEYKLRPPKPGVKFQRGDSSVALAKQAIIGQAINRRPPPKVEGSPGVLALLRETGGLTATPDIRATINEEASILSSKDQAFVDKLIFWVDEEPEGSTIVDARKERKRIQKNQALGKPITEGETPEIKIKRERKGLLNF